MDELNSIDAQEFADALKQVVGPASAQKRRAVVQQVDVDGTVWLQMPGSDKLVPISGSSAAVSPGDSVVAEFRGGALYVEGNASDPATGARHTDAAIGRAVKPIVADVAKAQEAADEAQAVADATNQHFFADGGGVHVTEAEGDATTEHNILINSLGILLRKAVNHLVSITQSAIAFYDGLGNAASNIVAQFGADGAQIGKAGESHVELDYASMRLVDEDGHSYLDISDMRELIGEFQQTFTGNGSTTDFLLLYYASEFTSVTVDGSPASAYSLVTNDYGSYLHFDSAPGAGASIFCEYEVDSGKCKSYTLGTRDNLYTDGVQSYVVGSSCVATGRNSYAEGYKTFANGNFSHAQNVGTRALSDFQTVIGRYNAEDLDGKYALIVGNGTSHNAQTNAAALRWDGTLELAKALPVASGGTGTTAFGTHYAPTMGATKSVASNTWTQLHNFKLAAGKWLIIAYLYAASNTTGSRQYRLTSSSTAPTSVSLDGDSLVLAGGNNSVYAVLPMFVEPSAETTYYMWATQNSGGALNMRANLTAIRLG